MNIIMFNEISTVDIDVSLKRGMNWFWIVFKKLSESELAREDKNGILISFSIFIFIYIIKYMYMYKHLCIYYKYIYV